jgi:hypothetical protein
MEEGAGDGGSGRNVGGGEWARGEVDGNRNTHSQALARVRPTEPLKLAKQAARMNLNRSDSSGRSLASALASQ